MPEGSSWGIPRRRAREAAAEALEDAVQEGELHPEDFSSILQDAVLFPSFSTELLRAGAIDKIRPSLEHFHGGDESQRQYFRNGQLCLHYEAAANVRQTFEVLWQKGGGRNDDWDGSMFMKGVLTTLYEPGERPSTLGENDDDQDDVGCRRFADFLLSRERYPYLVAWLRGDYFFVRRASRADASAEVADTVPTDGAVGDPALPAVGCDARQWLLGRVTWINADPKNDVSLVQLELVPFGAGGVEALGELQDEEFELAPVDFAPTVLRRESDALKSLCLPAFSKWCFTEFVKSLVFGNTEQLQRSSSDAGSQAIPPKPDEPSRPLVSSLNDQQWAAVAEATRSKVTLIQGPPGTGKSTVAAAIVEEWLRQDPKGKILVATGTHVSRALLTRRLEDKEKGPGYLLSSRNKSIKGRQPVYVETVYMGDGTRALPRVIIDESSQITEAAALVALGQGCEQLVLIGDPKQLSVPSVLGRYDERSTGEDDVLALDARPYSRERESFFERLISRHGLKPMSLDMQYRMDPRLRAWPGKRFYDGRLSDGIATEQLSKCAGWPRGLIFGDDVAYNDTPVVFVDTVSKDRHTVAVGAELSESSPEAVLDTRSKERLIAAAGDQSWENPLEAELVVRVVRRLQDLKVNPKDIVVLTCYSAQRDLITRLLNPGAAPAAVTRRWERRAARMRLGDKALDEDQEGHPRVHTVDSFQGSERDFVIFSAVRSNQEGLLGGCGDPRRMCVLLTRARKGLMVIGESSTLRSNKDWCDWLDNAGARRIHADALAPHPERMPVE